MLKYSIMRKQHYEVNTLEFLDESYLIWQNYSLGTITMKIS